MSNFLEPDPELAILKEDLAWPLTMTPNGDLAKVRGLGNLASAVSRRLITGRGHLEHRSEYGIDYDEFQNAPNLPEIHAVFEARTLEQMSRESRLQDVRVTVTADDDDTIAHIEGSPRTGSAAAIGVQVSLGA